VPLRPIFLSIPRGWEIVWWNNGDGTVTVTNSDAENFVDVQYSGVPDLGPHARFAAIEYASHDLILVQDDDVIVSDPQAIVDAWHRVIWESNGLCGPDGLHEGAVCNLPPEFRPHYPDSALVGFGACFHREAPGRAFERLTDWYVPNLGEGAVPEEWFNRCCDVVFTTLTPRVLVDVPKENREFAEGPDRMYRQPDHVGERARMLELARKVRDA
jgi:hypothetical protein